MARAQRRAPISPLEQYDPRFEGSSFSNQELAFLIEHLGEPAIVAMPPDEELPEGVNELAVGPVLDRTYGLEMYQQSLRDKHSDDTIMVWCGFEKLRAICRETLQWNAEVQELKRRTRGSAPELRRAAGAPSLHMWDPTTDVPYLYGVGADTDRVLTRLNADGTRTELHTELKNTGDGAIKSLAGVAAFIRSTSAAEQSSKLLQTPDELTIEEGESFGTVACPLCGKAETFEMLKSASKRMAINKILKHLDTEKVVKVNQHRLLSQRLKSGKAGSGKRRQVQVEP